MDGLMRDLTFGAQDLFCEACGRNFAQMNAYSIHIGRCRPQKKRMASALEEAKEKYRNKKARLNTSASQIRPATPDQVEVATEVSCCYFTAFESVYVPFHTRSPMFLTPSVKISMFQIQLPLRSVGHAARTDDFLCDIVMISRLPQLAYLSQ